MANVTCIACTVGDDVVEFPDMMEYKKHEMLGHTTRWQKELPKDPRGDHPSLTELRETGGKVKNAKQPETKTTEPEPEKLTPLEPLLLIYQWQGQCPNCRDHVKTIEVEIDPHNLIVAYCVRCNKKLGQQEVIPIKDQLQEEETFEQKLTGKKK